MIRINEVVQNFSFNGCAILKMEISNGFVSLNGRETMQLGLGAELSYEGLQNNEHHGKIIMQIDVEASREPEGVKSIIKTTFEGSFIGAISLSKEDFMQRLAINGAAALYSVARGRIDTITASVFASGKIDIPFVNFNNFYRLQEKTE